MQAQTREQTLAIWQEAERAARARLGEPGTLSLKQVSELSAQEFFDRIGSGELPARPSATWSTSSPWSGKRVASSSRAHRTPATTTRWAACTAATRRPCSTPAWAAPYTPGCNLARATPPWTCASAMCGRSPTRSARSAPKAVSSTSAAPPRLAEGRL